MTTIVEDSQLEEVGNTTEEAIFLSQTRTFAHAADTDPDSTADEEDDSPTQKTTSINISNRESAMNRLRDSNRPNTSSIYSNTRTNLKPLFETAESTELMEIDIVEKSQAPGDLFMQVARAAVSQPRMKIGGVLQDIFVGEELGDMRF